MATQENKPYKVVEKAKTIELITHEVEQNSVIVNVEGWRMRVYFDESFKGHVAVGSPIVVNYFGDINDPHSIRFVKLK